MPERESEPPRWTAEEFAAAAESIAADGLITIHVDDDGRVWFALTQAGKDRVEQKRSDDASS